MTPLGALTPVNSDQIQLGKALDFDVFDAWGNLLYERGSIIEDADEVTSLIADGYFEESLDTPNKPGEAILPAPSQMQGYAQPSAKQDAPTAPQHTPAAPLKANGEATSTASMSTATTSEADLNKESAMLDLDSVRWHVGEPFYLQVHDNPSIRYTVRLIGYVKNQSILVTAPKIDGRGALIRDGQTFIVRSFPGKRAYAFTASALKSVYTPHAYLHLSYPKIVRCTSIRQNSRASIKIIASVSVGQPEQSAAATLTDISMGGTSGLLKRAIGQKADRGVIKFKVNTAGEDAYLTLPIVVRSIAETENTEEFRYGFEFVDMPTQSKIILSSFVHQTLAETE